MVFVIGCVVIAMARSSPAVSELGCTWLGLSMVVVVVIHWRNCKINSTMTLALVPVKQVPTSRIILK